MSDTEKMVQLLSDALEDHLKTLLDIQRELEASNDGFKTKEYALSRIDKLVSLKMTGVKAQYRLWRMP